MTRSHPALAAALILLTACHGGAADARREAPPPAQAPRPPANDPAIAAIERRVGGRLGVSLIDDSGRVLLAHRADERFAMCSTFKLPLAAMALDRGDPLDTPLPITRADLLSNSPYADEVVAGRESSLGSALQAIVTRSDNAAANVILRRLGGPAAFTAWLRGKGDGVTRLDRYELALNENAPGDPRDTTTPAAIAALTARLVFGDALAPAPRAQLAAWMAESRTGQRRIRAGLPAGWQAGDKTGTCGTAWNDVAWLRDPNGRRYALAVYLDRPRVEGAAAEAVLAEVARIAAERAAR